MFSSASAITYFLALLWFTSAFSGNKNTKKEGNDSRNKSVASVQISSAENLSIGLKNLKIKNLQFSIGIISPKNYPFEEEKTAQPLIFSILHQKEDKNFEIVNWKMFN